MKKEGAIYWNKSSRNAPKRGRSGRVAGRNRKTPQWFIFTVAVSITFMLCLAINFRAFSEMRQQSLESSDLNTEIEELTTDNLGLQEEIQDLKSDAKTIAREARKIGMSRSNEKVLVPKH